MTKKIIALGASSSKESINKKFATFAAGLVENAEVTVLDLNDFEMPIYSIDRENESGIPELAQKFKQILADADGIVLSLAEHNSSYSVAYKNVFDWTSRIDRAVFGNNPLLLLATSPGGRGGKTVLETATAAYSRMNENVVVPFSLPSFSQNFSEEGIKDAELSGGFKAALDEFTAAL